MKIEIKNIWNGSVIFSHDVENNTVALTVKAALSASVSLSGADLRGANLRGDNLRDADLRGADLCDSYLRSANLRGANLCGASLRDADLCGADLCGANLRGASLRDADLCGADLCDSYLRGADLCGASLRDADLCGADLCDSYLRDSYLRGANLRGASLRDADLCGANLCDANITPIRDDIWAVLSSAPEEVPALIDALKAGKVDGSTYEGDCCCLVGTIANARHCDYNQIDSLKPNSRRPAERFFLGIKEGDTPETSQFSALAVQWAEEWLSRMQSTFGATK